MLGRQGNAHRPRIYFKDMLCNLKCWSQTVFVFLFFENPKKALRVNQQIFQVQLSHFKKNVIDLQSIASFPSMRSFFFLKVSTVSSSCQWKPNSVRTSPHHDACTAHSMQRQQEYGNTHGVGRCAAGSPELSSTRVGPGKDTHGTRARCGSTVLHEHQKSTSAPRLPMKAGCTQSVWRRRRCSRTAQASE